MLKPVGCFVACFIPFITPKTAVIIMIGLNTIAIRIIIFEKLRRSNKTSQTKLENNTSVIANEANASANET